MRPLPAGDAGVPGEIMSWHPSEEAFVEYCYEEVPVPDRDRLDAHLATCSACRLIVDGIVETLRDADSAEVPEPDPAFERTLWIGVAGRMAVPAEATPWRRLLPAGAWVLVALFVGAAALASLYQVRDAGTGTAGPADSVPGVQERVLLTALDDHFARTEVLLVELLNAPAEAPPRLAVESAIADDLVASGRLYRETARQRGEAHVTAVLEDLESVLVEVARGADRLAAQDLDRLRVQIDEYGLLFKVRAVGDRIRGQRAAALHHYE